jgi:hypothetical protein
MKYIIEISMRAMLYMLIFMKISLGFQKLMKGDSQTPAGRALRNQAQESIYV